jgi:hypothetical protein
MGLCFRTDFSPDLATDVNGVVINETAARIIGLDNPIGETLARNREGGEQRGEYKILGVISDMVKGSPFELTDPCLFFLSSGDQDCLFIRLDPSVSAHAALPKIEKVFQPVCSFGAIRLQICYGRIRGKVPRRRKDRGACHNLQYARYYNKLLGIIWVGRLRR